MWVTTYPYFLKCSVDTADHKNTSKNYALAWTSVFILAAISGTWIWLAVEFYKVMAHTFSWEMLLRTYGASFSLECPAGVLPSEGDWPPYLHNCTPISQAIPCIPIIALMVIFVSLTCAIICLFPVSLANLDAAASGVRVSLTWHVCFFVIATIVITYFHIVDSSSLKSVMNLALESSSDSKGGITPMWELTQNLNECCGVDDFNDWEASGGIYPNSCCSANITSCTKDFVWQTGCYARERSQMEIFGAIIFFLLCFQCFVNFYLCYLIECLKAVRFAKFIERGGQGEALELEAPLLK